MIRQRSRFDDPTGAHYDAEIEAYAEAAHQAHLAGECQRDCVHCEEEQEQEERDEREAHDTGQCKGPGDCKLCK